MSRSSPTKALGVLGDRSGRGARAEERLSNRLPRHAKGGLFIKGPIPIDWLGKAAALPGKSLNVALAVWFKCAMEGNGAAISRKTWKLFGVHRNTGRRVLRQLEAAGLVRVERHTGRSTRVTILELPRTPQSKGKRSRKKQTRCRAGLTVRRGTRRGA